MNQVAPQAARALSVSQLTGQIKELLENGFASVWVAGEISNISRPQSGHCYFTLRDAQAQIRAVVWNSTVRRLKLKLTDGLQAICHGHLDVYAPRGSYQLIVDQVQLLLLMNILKQLQKLMKKKNSNKPYWRKKETMAVHMWMS